MSMWASDIAVAGAAGLLGLVLVPLVLGSVPPNKWYGIRIPAAFKSTENWYRVNRLGGIVTLIYVGAAVLVYCFLRMGGWAEFVLLDLPSGFWLLSFGLGGLVATMLGFTVYAELMLPGSPEPRRCGQCGYNLTGNVSGVCPECGTTLARRDPGKGGAGDGTWRQT